ncbi:MAG: glycine zipper 2TM domain-containing protein [Rhodospirillales bacterium]|nr:glycine zipper 2TM domain-containing protein [Rhodospirillales bacterium]
MALAALVATGCAQQRLTTTEMSATALGAAAGGVLGFQLGGGWARTLFTAGGSILGGATGYMVGRRLEMSDRAMYSQVLAEALAGSDDGETRHWLNPETGRNGTIRPTRSFHRGDGMQLCRDYRSAVNFESDVATGAGTACRAPDGQWVPITAAFG